jgi:hypothetical protein
MGEAILTAGAAAEQRAVDWTVAWSPRGNPAQLALLKCPVFEVFFGGARGGGKTDGMLGEWAQHADRLMRRSRPYVPTREEKRPVVDSGYRPYRSVQPGDWLTY